jgi:hypothetical protein
MRDMNTQRIYQLLISVCVITAIAFVSEKSRVLASMLAVMPLNITIGLWFIYTGSQGDAATSADFSRMMLLGLIPTALFVAACWFGFNRGWPFGRVIVVGYAVWLVSMLIYRFIESQVNHV